MAYDVEIEDYGSDRPNQESTAIASAATPPQKVQYDQADVTLRERQCRIEELRRRRGALVQYALSLSPEMA